MRVSFERKKDGRVVTVYDFIQDGVPTTAECYPTGEAAVRQYRKENVVPFKREVTRG